MRTMRALQAGLLGWLLTASVAWPAGQPARPPASPVDAQSGKEKAQGTNQSSTAFPLPRTAAANRLQLPSAFTKTAPVSVSDLRSIEQHVKALIARVSPAVVAVEVGQGTGSGVVISPDGLVLTAGHVCGRAGRDVRFTFPDGRTARGKSLGADTETDAGLVRITDPGTWPYAKLGDMSQVRLGDWTLALGHPGGFDRQRSLVVRLGRVIRLGSDAFQTDCTISPGDSGGPLFDMHGRVVGIHSFISASATDNFHVPITRFQEGWAELVQGGNSPAGGSAVRVYVGARSVDSSEGCRLEAVVTNGPAYQAGLRTGDLVLKVNGLEVRVAATFDRWLAETEPGEKLDLEIRRGEKTLSLTVKAEAPPRRRRE